MPSQKWRKKSEHSRKNATFADCLRIKGLTIICRPFDKLRDLGSVPHQTTIQQLNSQQLNKIHGNQQQIQPSGS